MGDVRVVCLRGGAVCSDTPGEHEGVLRIRGQYDLDTALQHKLCLHMGVVVGMESLVNLFHPRWKCPLILKRLSEESFLLRQALFVVQPTGMFSGLICMFLVPLPRDPMI